MDGWVSSMKTMLGSVNDQRVKASSISDVPEQLRKTRKEAYMPKVVSIGPLHRQTRRELLYMEEIKWRCMRFLLFRTPKPDESLKNCSEAIYVLDEVVRAAYTDHIKLNDYDLAKIMLLDGCFLLELLISNDENLHRKLRNVSNEGKESPGAEVGKMELVLSDLKLLENQIPVFILTVLFQTLFVAEAQSFEGFRKIVNDSALSLLGGTCSSNSVISVYDSPNCAHFLELVHWFMTREVENNHHVSITVDGNGSTEPKQTLELKHCATRLEAVGVTIAPLDSDPEKEGSNSMSIRLENRKEAITFGCDNKFSKISKGSNKKLEIHPLHITETTEVQWRNLIAWEQNRTAHEKFLKVENRTRCKFTQYALLFRDLICCEHDIQLLKERKVLLVDEGKRSNEDVMNIFRKIASGIEIDASSGDGRFGQLINDLNTSSGARGNCRILWHRCRCIATSMRYTFRDMFEILKRDHTPTVWKTLGVIAAIVLLGLTIAQTTFAAISL